MQDILLLQFNNYYNRIIKNPSKQISDYIKFATQNIIEKINFNPNDGVNTEHIFNIDTIKGQPDYMLVIENNEIISRWFVIEASRTRLNQYRLELRRDLVGEYIVDIMKAPMFIEKATLDASNPLIFNSEDMTFNQIKKSETILKDETQIPWIVGYCDANSTPEDNIAAFNRTIQPDYIVNNLDDFDYYNNIATEGLGGNEPFAELIGFSYQINTRTLLMAFDSNGGKAVYNEQNQEIGEGVINYQGYFGTFENEGLTIVKAWPPQQILSSLTPYANTDLYNSFKSATGIIDSTSDIVNFKNQNGKIIQVNSTGKLYQISISNNAYGPAKAEQNFYIPPKNSVQYQNMLNIVNNISLFKVDDPIATCFKFNYTTLNYYIYLTEISGDSVAVTIAPHATRTNLSDAPYSMFCIPYGEITINFENSSFQVNKEDSFRICIEIARKFSGAGYLYDLQILPYCPTRKYIMADGSFSLADATDGNDYNMINENLESGAVPRSVLIWCDRSSFTFDIAENINIEDFKIESQCDMYRLCSPNYSGIFEFNAAKNGGVKYINVDCTYKPFNPYIHLNPNFSRLYGRDFNDSRGLICGGDYSFPIVTDAWATYELQNKNYQQMFDREIQNMEIGYKYQRIQDIFGAIAGTGAGGIAGGMSGARFGPAGAVGGAVAGSVMSGAAGVFDVYMKEQLRSEALDYKRDMFGFQLGNIQALPNSLAKVSAFSANNKIWPFIEKYSCTDIEKTALKNKIKYNGMTVMAIGTLEEYIRPERTYIKGKLIRLETIAEEFHFINAIAEELYKGIYIGITDLGGIT